MHAGATYPPESNWVHRLVAPDRTEVPQIGTRVAQMEVCQFLASTAKRWGTRCRFRELWREDPQDKLSWQLLGPCPNIPWPGQASHDQQDSWLAKPNLSPSPSSLCSPYNRPMNQRRGVEARNMTLFRRPADREDGRLVSLKNHLIWVWMPVSFIESERERQWGS